MSRNTRIGLDLLVKNFSLTEYPDEPAIFDSEETPENVAQKIIIKNPTGLHLRPAGNLCKEAMRHWQKEIYCAFMSCVLLGIM